MGQHIARHIFLPTEEAISIQNLSTRYSSDIAIKGFSVMGVWIILPILTQLPPPGAYVEFYLEEQWAPGKTFYRRYHVPSVSSTASTAYQRWRIRAPWGTDRNVNIQIPINGKTARLGFLANWNPHQSLTYDIMLMSE